MAFSASSTGLGAGRTFCRYASWGISLDVNGQFGSTWCTLPVSWRPKVEETPEDAGILAGILLSIDHPHPLFFYRAVFTGLTGEVTEWPIVHDWKSCVPYKGTEGSNPSLSAKVHNILEKGIGLHSCLSCASM